MDVVKKLCTVNQYANQLCQRKDYWLNRINVEQLSLPDVHIDNWLKAYHALKMASTDMDELGDRNHTPIQYKINSKIDKKYFTSIMVKNNIPVPEVINNKFFITYDSENGYVLIYRNNYISATSDELKKILFHAYYDGAISDVVY